MLKRVVAAPSHAVCVQSSVPSGPGSWVRSLKTSRSQHSYAAQSSETIGCAASCFAGGPSAQTSFVERRAWGKGRSYKEKPWAGPSAVLYTEGPAGGEACVDISKHSVPLGHSLPKISGIRATRTSTEEVRETPRLKVDRLKGNVFVNQYLVIKDLGRGAHGTVKLVFDTEQQVVFAMKVIHRKAPNHHRRYSFDIGAHYSHSPAYSGSPQPGLSGLTRGNSVVAADAYIQSLAAGASMAGSSPFAAAPFVGGQLQPLYSATGTWPDGSNTGSRPASSIGKSHENSSPQQTTNLHSSQPQHIIDEALHHGEHGSHGGSSIGFRSSPGLLQHSGGHALSNPGVLRQEQLYGLKPVADLEDFLLPIDPPAGLQQQKGEAEACETPKIGHGGTIDDAAAAAGIITPPSTSTAGADNVSADGMVSLAVSTTNNIQADKQADAAGLELGPKALVAGATQDATAELQPDKDSTHTAAAADGLPGQSPPSPLPPRLSVHHPHISMDTISLASGRSGSPAGWPVSTGSPLPVAAMVADAQTAELMREMAVMKKLDHPHVVALHEIIHDPDAKVLIMVMEFMPGGPLLSSAGHGMTEPLPETAARRYFRELVSGLDYLHFNLIIHGDLKPDNLLLSAEGQLKISDFGSAMMLPSADSLISSTPGTPAFMAPEMCGFKSSPYKPFPAECWALGVCLYMFVFGKVPYAAPSTGILYEYIRSSQPVDFPQHPAVSNELKSLMRGLLDKNPETRFGLQQVCCHEWLTDHGRLPPIRRCCEQQQDGHASPVGAAVSKADQKNALTGLKQQVKEAIPSVEERTYRRGQVLVEQGKVPEGLFLILRGECELVISHTLPDLNSTAEACGVQVSGYSVAAVKKDSDMDFAAQLSSSSCSDEDEQTEESENASYSPLMRSYNASAALSEKIAQLAIAAVTGGAGLLGTDNSGALLKLSEGRQQQLDQTIPSRPDADANTGTAADAAMQSADGGGVLSMEDILPQLLPPSRWPAAGVPPLTISSFSGATDSAPLPEVAASRSPAKSAGPALLGDAEPSFSGQVPSVDVSAEASPGASPVFGARGRPRSESVDFSQAGAPGHDVMHASIDRGSLYSQDSTAGYMLGSPSPGASPPLSARLPNPLTHGAFPGLRHHLNQASAPDLRQLLHGHRSFLMDSMGRPGSASPTIGGGLGSPRPGSPSGLLVQRSASSATMGRVINRAVRRSESMHKRMKSLVDHAKMITEHNQKRQELVGIRGPGHVVGDMSLGSRATPATATVRARTRMKVLLVLRADAAALKHQPGVKAALCRTQTESSVLEALEHFATYDGEVTTIDELRKGLAAASQSMMQLAGSFSAGPRSAPLPMLSPAAVAAGAHDSAGGSFSGPAGLQGRFAAGLNASGNSSPLPSNAVAVSGGPGSSHSASSFSALAMHPASRGNSFTAAAAVAALSNQSSLDYSQGLPSPRTPRSVTPGYATPPSGLGLSGTSSHVIGVGTSALPSRVSSSTRFALSAASANQLPALPSPTAAGRQPSQNALFKR